MVADLTKLAVVFYNPIYERRLCVKQATGNGAIKRNIYWVPVDHCPLDQICKQISKGCSFIYKKLLAKQAKDLQVVFYPAHKT